MLTLFQGYVGTCFCRAKCLFSLTMVYNTETNRSSVVDRSISQSVNQYYLWW